MSNQPPLEYKFQLKSLWLTSYVLVTWSWDGSLSYFWKTLDVGLYPGGLDEM